MLAIGVLGSIARGTWDVWSDLDLDIVTTGELDAVAEGRRFGGPDALVLPTRPGEVDVGLPSLEEFSIRYYRLARPTPHDVGALKTDRVHYGKDIVRDMIAFVGARIVWFAAAPVATTIHADHLAALSEEEVDPPPLPPIGLETRGEAVHEQDRASCADYLVVDRYATRTQSLA